MQSIAGSVYHPRWWPQSIISTRFLPEGLDRVRPPGFTGGLSCHSKSGTPVLSPAMLQIGSVSGSLPSMSSRWANQNRRPI